MWQIPGDPASPEIPGIPGLDFHPLQHLDFPHYHQQYAIQPIECLQFSIPGEDYPTKGLKDLCALNPRNPGC